MMRPTGWLVTRTRDGLARLTPVSAAGVVVLGLTVVRYVGRIGLSVGAMADDSDDRTVVNGEGERADRGRNRHDEPTQGPRDL